MEAGDKGGEVVDGGGAAHGGGDGGGGEACRGVREEVGKKRRGRRGEGRRPW